MIRYLSGTIIEQTETFVTLENSGIGYQIFIPVTAHGQNVGGQIGLWIADIVREDSHDLYGFMDATDLGMFELLTSVSGVGPKLGLSIVHAVPGNGIMRAISQNDAGYLSSLPGIGKKTAEKIILELRDKISDISSSGTVTQYGSSHQDVIDGLVGLGFAERSVREALMAMDTADKDTSVIMKEVMKLLSN